MPATKISFLYTAIILLEIMEDFMHNVCRFAEQMTLKIVIQMNLLVSVNAFTGRMSWKGV